MQRHKIFSNIVSRLGYAENRTDVLSIVELKFTGDRLWLSVADANSELGKGWEEIEYRNPKAIRHRASKAESAIAALNCSGAVLGSLPIRVSPSKTPVRPRAPRPPLH
ncbi:hypothetical protein WN943_014956 [Citrus x changshan-huyou]